MAYFLLSYHICVYLLVLSPEPLHNLWPRPQSLVHQRHDHFLEILFVWIWVVGVRERVREREREGGSEGDRGRGRKREGEGERDG